MAKPVPKGKSAPAPAKPKGTVRKRGEAVEAPKQAAAPSQKAVDERGKRDLAERARAIQTLEGMDNAAALQRSVIQEAIQQYGLGPVAEAFNAAGIPPEKTRAIMEGGAAPAAAPTPTPAPTAVSNENPVITRTNLAPVPAEMSAPSAAAPDMSWMYDRFGEVDKKAIDQFLIDNNYDPDDLDGMTIDEKMAAVQSELGKQAPDQAPVAAQSPAPAPAPSPAAAAPGLSAEDVQLLKDQYGFTDQQIASMQPGEIAATLDQIRSEMQPAAAEPAAPDAPAQNPVAAAAVADAVQQAPNQRYAQAFLDLFAAGYTIDDINAMDPATLGRAVAYAQMGGKKSAPTSPVAGLTGERQRLIPEIAFPAQREFDELLRGGYDAQAQARFSPDARQRALAYVRAGGRAPTPMDSPRAAPVAPAPAATTAPVTAVDPVAMASVSALFPDQPAPSIPDMIARLAQWQQSGTPGTPSYRQPDYMVSRMDEWQREQQARANAGTDQSQTGTVSGQNAPPATPATPPTMMGRAMQAATILGGGALALGAARYFTADNRANEDTNARLQRIWQQNMRNARFQTPAAAPAQPAGAGWGQPQVAQ